jgi:hypothetical protein
MGCDRLTALRPSAGAIRGWCGRGSSRGRARHAPGRSPSSSPWSRPPRWDRVHGTRPNTPAHLARLRLARLVRGTVFATRAIEIVSGTGHWSRIGEDLVAVRGVYVHEGTGTHRDEDGFTTALTMNPQQMVACDTQRGSIATTLQECREDRKRESTQGAGPHPGLRFTPGVFGRDTMVVRLALQLPKSSSRLRAILWRGQSTVTCSDRRTGVCRALWDPWGVHTGAHAPECSQRSPSFQEPILDALAPAASRTGKDMSQARTFLEGMAGRKGNSRAKTLSRQL